MRRRTLLLLPFCVVLLAASLGMTAVSGPQSEAAVDLTSDPAAVSICNCNVNVGLCQQAGQTCQACPCLSTDSSKNGVCK